MLYQSLNTRNKLVRENGANIRVFREYHLKNSFRDGRQNIKLGSTDPGPSFATN